MHPLITAYWLLTQLRACRPRQESPYLPIWERMFKERVEFIDALWAAEQLGDR